jgi:hypothetical protein
MTLVQTEPTSIKIWSTAVSAVYVWDTKVRPVAPVEYEVTANTFLYMPLKTNYTDYGTGSTVDWNTWNGVWGCTIANGYLYIPREWYINNQARNQSWAWAKTISFWFKWVNNSGSNGWVDIMGYYADNTEGKLYMNADNWNIGFCDGNWMYSPTQTPQWQVSIPNPTTQRHLFCAVADTDASKHYVYVDWVLASTINNVTAIFQWWWGRAFNTVKWSYTIGININELIVDKGMFTADFISKYYKSNKGNYWL